MGFSIRVRVRVRLEFSIRLRVRVRLGFSNRVRIRVQIWKYLSPLKLKCHTAGMRKN